MSDKTKRGQFGQEASQPSAGLTPHVEKGVNSNPQHGSRALPGKTNQCDETVRTGPKAEAVRDAQPSNAGRIAKAEHLAARKQK